MLIPSYQALSKGAGGGMPGGAPPGAPVLFFTDLASGPSTGNSDTSAGTGGAIVTVWGQNLGSSQGGSSITIGGASAPVYEWRNADGAASNMYVKHRMQMISFLVPSSLGNGSHNIQVTVGGVASNTLTFTVRSGNIYYVKTTGNDSTGTGSFSNPWRNIPKAVDSIANGDIIYPCDGIIATAAHAFHGCVNLGQDGTAASPRALCAYPGATVTVGTTSGLADQPFDNFNTVTGTHSLYWTVSKIKVLGVGPHTGSSGDGVGLPSFWGWRVIGNYMRIPHPADNSQASVTGGEGSDAYIFGNEILESAIDNPTTVTKLFHVIYMSGKRSSSLFGDTCGGVRCPTETNKQVCWNYLHDNHNNRGINFYSEQDLSAYLTGNICRYNWIENQRGDGILIGYYVVDENWFEHNMIINCGLNPAWADGDSGHNAIQINGGYDSGIATTLHIRRNTIYSGGVGGQALLFYYRFQPAVSGVTVDFDGNIVYSNTASVPYWETESGLANPSGTPLNVWYGQASGKPAWNTGGVEADPLFVNAAAGDFHLQGGSPAAGIGADLGY